MDREDSQDPLAVYQAIGVELAAVEASRHALQLRRDLALRDLVEQCQAEVAAMGLTRGAIAVTAQRLGVSDARVHQLLAGGVYRASRAALASWDPDEYTLARQSGTVTVTLGLDVLDRGPVAGGNAANSLVSDLRAAGLEVSADGLAVDVDGQGPCAALARGEVVAVEWGPVAVAAAASAEEERQVEVEAAQAWVEHAVGCDDPECAGGDHLR
jgi:hypothetical protein